MTAKEVLLKAAEYIETHGWTTGRFGGFYPSNPGYPCETWEDVDAPACALGAIRSVNPEYRKGKYVDAFHNPAAEALQRYLGKAVQDWNDVFGRTQAEVVGTLRQVAESL